MFKNIKLIIFALVIFSLGVFVLVSAQEGPPPICGDGVVNQAWEECDDGNHNLIDQCDTFGETPNTQGLCKKTFCGDGIVQAFNGQAVNEKCDTGNNDKGYCINNLNWECDAEDVCKEEARCIYPTCTPGCGGIKLLGWAWADTFGWLSLNEANCDYIRYGVPANICQNREFDYFIQIDFSNYLKGWAWSDNIGWVCFGQTCSGTAPDGQGAWAEVQENGENPEVTGWAQALVLGSDGWFSLNCSNFGYCGTSDHKVQVGLKDVRKRLSENEYGPTTTEKVLGGFAWNNNNQGGGLGWLWFDPLIEEIAPWLQTQYGDVYARRGITASAEPPSGSWNAAYRILAQGDIKSFVSLKKGNEWVDPSYGPIDFPTPKTRYSNILGKLDVEGLICTNWDSQHECLNKYGKKVVDLTKVNLRDIAKTDSLAGKIYYHQGDLQISGSDIVFNNASGFANGSGTIIIDGDLRIYSDIFYGPSGGLDKFRNLASVAWIVKGDVIVEPAVENLVGAFIVLGDGESTCPAERCGHFKSGIGAEKRLVVSGLIMARQFDFGRQFVDETEYPRLGSEVIIYDGRLLANIPPGLEDFASALPIWRSGTFSN